MDQIDISFKDVIDRDEALRLLNYSIGVGTYSEMNSVVRLTDEQYNQLSRYLDEEELIKGSVMLYNLLFNLKAALNHFECAIENDTVKMNGLIKLYNPEFAYFLEKEFYKDYYWNSDKQIPKIRKHVLKRESEHYAKVQKLYTDLDALKLRVKHSFKKAISFLMLNLYCNPEQLENAINIAESQFECELYLEWGFPMYFQDCED